VCVKDAEAIYELLITSGFDQKLARILSDSSNLEPTRIEILKTLKIVAEATEPEDLLLFYFSGHGGEFDSESYLLSRDANRSILSDSTVPISRVKEIMEEAPAQAKAIILDACHSGAKIDGKGASVMSASFIRNVFEESEGIAILASCKQGELSYEWKDEGRSVFTRILLDALSGKADRDNKGFVTVQDVNRHVVDGVKEWAVRNGVSQNPTSQTSMVGDIPLVRY
jgi:uncharacterized caspase-like protein